MVTTALTSSRTGCNQPFDMTNSKAVTKRKRVRYKIENKRKFVMNHWITFDSGGVGSGEQTLVQNHYTKLQSPQWYTYLTKIWLQVCGTVARTYPQNSNHSNHKGWSPNLLLSLFSSFCLFVFAVFILNFELQSISFTSTIALNCTIFDLVFDAVVDKAVVKIHVAVVDSVTVSMSIISGGTISGCWWLFLGGGFNWWICCCHSLSSNDFIVSHVASIPCASLVTIVPVNSLNLSMSVCK